MRVKKTKAKEIAIVLAFGLILLALAILKHNPTSWVVFILVIVASLLAGIVAYLTEI